MDINIFKTTNMIQEAIWNALTPRRAPRGMTQMGVRNRHLCIRTHAVSHLEELSPAGMQVQVLRESWRVGWGELG